MPAPAKSNDVQSEKMAAERLKAEGNQYFAKKQYQQALERYTMSLLMTETSVVLSNRALVWLKLNKPKNACIDASAALEIEDNLKSRFRRANAFFQLKLYNQARIDLILCYQMSPNDADVLRLSKELESADARERHERAVKADGKDIFYLGQVHAAKFLGDYPFRLITLGYNNDDEQNIPLDSWRELGKKLAHNRSKLVEIRVEDMELGEESLRDFFSAVDPICFTGDLVLSNVQFSKASILQILFSQLVKPEMVQFSGIQGISGESFSRALNSLPGLQLATTVVVLPGSSPDAQMTDFKLNDDEVVNFLHNYGTTKYRRLVTDFNLLSGGFDGIVHRLFEKFGSDSNTCPYELIVLCPQQVLPMCRSFNQVTQERLVAKVLKEFPVGHQMYPGHVLPALATPSSMLIVRRGC